MPLDDIMTFDEVEAFERLATRGSLENAYVLVSRTLYELFDQGVRDTGTEPQQAHRYLAGKAGISPFFYGAPNYETALAHLTRIANTQRSYLDGNATAHETKAQQARPLRREPEAQGRTPL